GRSPVWRPERHGLRSLHQQHVRRSRPTAQDRPSRDRDRSGALRRRRDAREAGRRDRAGPAQARRHPLSRRAGADRAGEAARVGHSHRRRSARGHEAVEREARRTLSDGGKMKRELLIMGPMYPATLQVLEETYIAHKLWLAADRDALLASLSDRIDAVATSGTKGMDDATMAKLP